MTPHDSYLGLDLGTSAIKGVLTDERGQVIAEAAAPTLHQHPREGWVELDPEQHYRTVCQVIAELAAAAPGQVAGLAMAAASGNTLLTTADGQPLTHIISWLDNRADQDLPRSLETLTVAEVAQVTGWPCVSTFPLAHLAWLQEHMPDLYTAAGHYAMDTDWLLYRLTGRWLMDHSTATTFHLQDQVGRHYHQPFLDRLGIPLAKLSALAPVGAVAGPLTAAACRDTGLSPRTRVMTGCFDHPAAARGTGVTRPGQLLLSCGTSWVGFTPFMDRQTILEAGLLCDPFLSADGGPYGAIFSVRAVGPTIDWYIHHLIAPGEADAMQVFNDAAAMAPPGANGLVIDLQRAPQPVTASREDISRAVMEGVARLLNAKLQASREYGFCYDSAIMVGGPSKSPIWPGIVAEVTGLEVAVGDASAGAQGAARLARPQDLPAEP